MQSENTFSYLLGKYAEDIKKADSNLSVTDTQKKILINIARNTLNTYLTKGIIPDIIIDDPIFSEPRATFVTLRNRETNELRGCKGEIFPTKPLFKSVQQTAISAALNDPRFPEVNPEELNTLRIEISILLPISAIKPEDIILGLHGLIIARGDNTALFLPHVPIIYKMDKEKYLSELCNKAGLSEEALNDENTALYGFRALVLEED